MVRMAESVVTPDKSDEKVNKIKLIVKDSRQFN